MEAYFKQIWSQVGECMLFSLLGASMSIDDLGGDTVGKGIGIIYISLIFRALAAILAVHFTTNWTFKEKIFTAITWCPKATVQAALSSVAITYVEDNPTEFCASGLSGTACTDDQGYKDAHQNGTDLKTIAILSIIATAPLFAALMDWGGYVLLDEPEEAVPEKETTFALVTHIGGETRPRVKSKGKPLSGSEAWSSFRSKHLKESHDFEHAHDASGADLDEHEAQARREALADKAGKRLAHGDKNTHKTVTEAGGVVQVHH
jgi:hypothetical protein